jgi:hypothetical protein
MRSLDEALNLFAYHPATPEVAAKYAKLRGLVMELAQDSWDLIPPGAEKTLAYRGLQDFLLHANCAVAMTTEADLVTPHVARVLPTPAEAAQAGMDYIKARYGDQDQAGRVRDCIGGTCTCQPNGRGDLENR